MASTTTTTTTTTPLSIPLPIAVPLHQLLPAAATAASAFPGATAPPLPAAELHLERIPFTIPLSHTTWRRTGVAQPVLVSVGIYFRRPLGAAASRDDLDGEDGGGDLSYGDVAREVVRFVERWERGAGQEEATGGGGPAREEPGVLETPSMAAGKGSVTHLLEDLLLHLTGWDLKGSPHVTTRTQHQLGKDAKHDHHTDTGSSEPSHEPPSSPPPPPPLITTRLTTHIDLTIDLPKAALCGEAVRIQLATAFRARDGAPLAYTLAVELRRLMVPTLIGLRQFERGAKQLVYTDVRVEGVALGRGAGGAKGREVVKEEAGAEEEQGEDVLDGYCELEQIAVKTLEESTFQTLEALAYQIAQRAHTYYVLPFFPDATNHQDDHHQHEHEHEHAHAHDQKQGHTHDHDRDQGTESTHKLEPPSPFPSPQIFVTITKPHGVPRSDAPVVRIRYDHRAMAELLGGDADADADAESEREGKGSGLGGRDGDGSVGDGRVIGRQRRRVPYPLQGRLDEWIVGMESGKR